MFLDLVVSCCYTAHPSHAFHIVLIAMATVDDVRTTARVFSHSGSSGRFKRSRSSDDTGTSRFVGSYWGSLYP